MTKVRRMIARRKPGKKGARSAPYVFNLKFAVGYVGGDLLEHDIEAAAESGELAILNAPFLAYNALRGASASQGHNTMFTSFTLLSATHGGETLEAFNDLQAVAAWCAKTPTK